jgi:hypothetical protein
MRKRISLLMKLSLLGLHRVLLLLAMGLLGISNTKAKGILIKEAMGKLLLRKAQ